MNRAQAYRIVAATWPHDRSAIQRVRHAVFVEEQGIPERLEWDGRDAGCRHVLALTEKDVAVATGRLLADGRIGRMAVLQAWRGRGVGHAMLQRLLQLAAHGGLQSVYVHAQVDVAGFYSRAGFQLAGAPFMTAGIAHVEMKKTLESG